jgi:hypothetical protein
LDAPSERPAGARSRAIAVAAHALLVATGVFVLVLALAVAEGVARWWEPGYLVRARGLHVYSRESGWAGRPRAIAPMGGGLATLDDSGFRGRTLETPRPAGRTRVVVLGDSIAFGAGVADEQAFPGLIGAGDNGIEAANLGVQGYGPGQELIVLRTHGFRYEPDVVLLAFCLRNDFADAMIPVDLYNGVTPRPVFRLDGERLTLDDSPVRRSAIGRLAVWLADYSHLFNRTASRLARPPEPERDWRDRKRAALRDADAALRLCVALVLEMDRLCRARGIRFLVATFPNGLSYEMESDLADAFHEALAAAGVLTVDMTERFRSAGATAADLALDRTGHLGPRGHALAAEVLEREIAARVR